MLFDLLHAHARHEITPEADDACGQALVGEILHAHVCHIEVRGVDAGEIRFPGKARFVRAAGIEGLHIRVQPGHDLHDGETLLHSIGGQRLEAVRPAQPLRTGPSTRCRLARRNGVPSAC